MSARHAVLALAFTALLPIAAPAAERVQIVLDASGSMWGRVGEEPKIDVARSAVREMLDGWDESVELGLTVYGHRQKGDCGDIETLIPAGPVDSAAFMDAVNGLSPKGKTPLSDAVKRAAEDLRYTEDRAAVVLVSDGIETCHADPCAAAAALEAAGVDFTVHVVGFDLKEGEDQKLRCIAEKTGGKFWLASDAAGLTDAFTQVVEVVAAPEPAPAPPPAAKFEGVKLVPLMSAGGEVIDGGVEWTALSPDVDFEGNREKRAYQWNTATQIFPLAPGSHLVVGKYGDVAVEETIEVETGDGETFEIVFDAAKFRVTALLADGGMELTGVEWKILAKQVDFEGNRAQVAYNWNTSPGHIFTIPAGSYELQAKYGDAAENTDFSVQPGEKKALSLGMDAAQVRLDGVLTEGAEPVSGVEWKILALEADFEGNRAQIAYNWNTAPGHMFTIPAGSYELLTTFGSVTRSVPLAVSAGERKRVTVDLRAAQVTLTMKPGEAHAPVNGVEWKVFNVSNEQVAYNWNTAPGHGFTLPAGTYKIVYNGQGLAGETRVTLGAGEQRAVEVIGKPQSPASM